jgi:hypothetical protein
MPQQTCPRSETNYNFFFCCETRFYYLSTTTTTIIRKMINKSIFKYILQQLKVSIWLLPNVSGGAIDAQNDERRLPLAAVGRPHVCVTILRTCHQSIGFLCPINTGHQLIVLKSCVFVVKKSCFVLVGRKKKKNLSRSTNKNNAILSLIKQFKSNKINKIFVIQPN